MKGTHIYFMLPYTFNDDKSQPYWVVLISLWNNIMKSYPSTFLLNNCPFLSFLLTDVYTF